ncbi:MAG: hypothetical protein WCL04_10190 [Verrucomicrobiota bacterium]
MNLTTKQSHFGRSASRSSERGAALLAALCFATVLAVALGSYLTVCYRTLQMSARGVQSTRSVELAETGMEEALWALNKNDWSGWTLSGSTATKTLTGFTYDNNVTGDISLTVTSYNGTAGTRTVTVTGTTHTPNSADISRTLTSSSAQAPLFVNAVAATTSTVVFSSAGTLDSYDSSLGTYASQTPTYSAIVSSSAPATTSATVTLVNAQVKGYVASLYSGGPSVSTSARVYGPSTPGTTKIDTSRVSTSPYQPVFTIKTISGTGTTLVNPALDSTTTIGNSSDTTPAIYYCSGPDMRGTTKIVVDGPVRLVVSGNFYVGLNGGSPKIEVTTNGTLEVFAGNDIAIYGGGIDNKTKDPSRLAVYSNNTLTVPDMNTATAYYGVIYTPTGCFTVAGNSTIYGSVVAKKVSLTGSAPVIHYDLNLRTKVFGGIDTPFAVSDWRESINGS